MDLLRDVRRVKMIKKIFKWGKVDVFLKYGIDEERKSNNGVQDSLDSHTCLAYVLLCFIPVDPILQ